MKLLDQYKDEKASIKREHQSGHWIQHKVEIGVAQEKQMEVCDVCGAFLIVNDVQQRVDDHLMGKQHVGYGRLKTALDELIEKRKHEDTSKSDDRVRNDGDYDRGRRDKRESRERDRYRDRNRSDRRDWDRHKRQRSRSPELKRKSRDRSRSRERHRSHGNSNGSNK